MERAEDNAVLLTDPDFQKILTRWNDLKAPDRAAVYQKYGLTDREIKLLMQLWLSLDFRLFELPAPVIEQALDETLWHLAERKAVRSNRFGWNGFYSVFSKIAAIIIIPLLCYTAYVRFFSLNNLSSSDTLNMVTVDSQPGTVTKLNLPDGSQVWLNAGSSLSYPNMFHNSVREVALSGEAYFEVVKNKQMPMIVTAGDMRIKVYGTSFNVNASLSEPHINVTLVEGTVSLSSVSEKINNQDEFFITPGQTATFNTSSGKLLLRNEDPFLFTAWKDGILVFRNTTFESVLERLSRKFNVDIELKDQSLASIPMDARFKDEGILEILRLLSSGTPFSYSYETPRKLPDGTFVKGKICIEKK